ncbi:MAG TPA: D-Ala-D-Ala carboxypeptidase family metallohydrolase [Hyphomicrobiaceae bacterium]|nr:D-Ala-D-Ala carboxypeptidase family metallohydrolase [Hyphomicrobiaceae bacterium]
MGVLDQLAGLDMNARTLFNRLKAEYPDIKATSGYRDPAHNARVGGAKGSQHLERKAVDLRLPEHWNEQQLSAFYSRARSLGARGAGYYGVTPGQGHAAHVDVRNTGDVTWGPDRRSASSPPWLSAAWDGKTAPPPPGILEQEAMGFPSQAIPSPSPYEDVAANQPQQQQQSPIVAALDQIAQRLRQPQQQPQQTAQLAPWRARNIGS